MTDDDWPDLAYDEALDALMQESDRVIADYTNADPPDEEEE